jgi:hypothetical protein
MQEPASVIPAPAHEVRDEDHGENDRQGPEEYAADHAHAGQEVIQSTRIGPIR